MSQLIQSGGVQSITQLNSIVYPDFNGEYKETEAGSFDINISSGITSDGVVLFQTNMNVFSGGTANSTTVNSEGKITVAEGGTVNFTTIHSYGYLSNGGTANYTTVNARGSMFLTNGGTAKNTTIHSAGNLYISSGGTAENTIVSGGYFYLNAEGTAKNTAINPGGEMYIYSGGSATEILENGGYVYVQAGADVTFLSNTISGLTISTHDSMTVHANTIANDTNVNSECKIYIYSGGTANRTKINEGEMYLSGFGTANNTEVYSSGMMYIYSGAAANNTIIGTYGSMFVSKGGIANNTTIHSSGRMYVSSGATVNSVTVDVKGSMTIAKGGNATEILENGGYVSAAEGANITFASNTIKDLTVERGMTVHSNTVANGTVVKNRGSMFIYSGGAASNTKVSGGQMNVGGKANYTSVFSGGKLNVSAGGSMFGVNLYTGANLNISSGGTVNTVFYNGKASATVSSGGTIASTTVNSNGTLTMRSGAKAEYITLKNGGTMKYYGGTCYYVDLLYGGVLTIESGAVRQSQIADKGTIIVSNGGTASGCITKSGGVMNVLSGGSADDTQLLTNGSMYVSGGIVTDMVTKHGARVHVFGGTLSNTTMERGITSVYQGGNVIQTKVGFGAYLMLGFTNSGCSGTASAYDTIVSSGGGLTVMSGAVADTNLIQYTGTLTCNNGGKLAGETIIQGRANLAGEAIVTEETAITFDVSERAVSAMKESYREAILNSYYVAREADMTVSVAADQAEGSYILANWAGSANQKTFTLKVDGTEVGTFSTGNCLTYDGKTYSLYCFDDATNSKALTLKVSTASDTAALTEGWTDLGEASDEILIPDNANIYAQESGDPLTGSDKLAGFADCTCETACDLCICKMAEDPAAEWLMKTEPSIGTLAIA